MLTDKQIKAFKPKEKEYTVSDDNRQRGTGRLILRVRPSGTKEWMYRYHLDGRKRRLSLGNYPSITLSRAREDAQDLATVITSGKDPADYLRDKRAEQTLSRNKGTLGNLCDAYCDDMAVRGKSSAEETRERLYRYIKTPFATKWKTPAAEITPHDISDMLAHHMARGITTTTNRVRSYLHAAYQYGIESELDPRRRSKAGSWGLESNPVASIPRQADWERQGQTVMSSQDVRDAWYGLMKMRSRSNLAALAVRLVIATGGQRISALLRLEVSNVNLESGIIDMPPEITKTSAPHVVPIGSHAKEVLSLLVEQSESRGFKKLFPGHRDKESTLREDSVSSFVSDYRAKTSANHWTVRDIRRTAKTIMGELGVTKEDRDRIHGHAMHDVSSKNYDRYEYLREKKAGMAVWDAWLTDVLK